jgi:hypothetical protein
VGTTIAGTDTTQATSTTAAALKTAGGLAVVKRSYLGDSVIMPTDNNLPGAGSFGRQAGSGYTIWPSTGSTYDFLLYPADGAAVNPLPIAVPTGTGNLVFGGTVKSAKGISVGNATPSTSSGVAFPATAVAVADANTLDDYEEGTFTAAIATASGTVSTNAATGYYTKIGNQVSVRGYLNVTSVSTPSGEANITGLPFTSGGTYIGASIYLVDIAATAVTSVQAYVAPSGTTITVVIYNAGARIPAGPYFVANAQVMYSATYNI